MGKAARALSNADVSIYPVDAQGFMPPNAVELRFAARDPSTGATGSLYIPAARLIQP